MCLVSSEPLKRVGEYEVMGDYIIDLGSVYKNNILEDRNTEMGFQFQFDNTSIFTDGKGNYKTKKSIKHKGVVALFNQVQK